MKPLWKLLYTEVITECKYNQWQLQRKYRTSLFSLGCFYLDFIHLPGSASHSCQEDSAASLHERASEPDREPAAARGSRPAEPSSHGASRPGPVGPGVSL